jgi:hypothetical protein
MAWGIRIMESIPFIMEVAMSMAMLITKKYISVPILAPKKKAMVNVFKN